MENKENTTCEYFEQGSEWDDSLSLCNFSMQDNTGSSVMQSPRNSSAEEPFEFSSTLVSSIAYPDIIFCGKIIHEDQANHNDDQHRDYLATVRSKTFGRPPSVMNEEIDVSVGKDSPSPFRFSASQPTKHSANYQIQKVNLTSLTSMSAKSRRWMFMFGPVKFKPEMELSAIKERQGRRVPTTMIPAPADGMKTLVSPGSGKPRVKSSRWGMIRSLRGRSYFPTMLAKSLGCIGPGVGVEKWIGVAN